MWLLNLSNFTFFPNFSIIRLANFSTSFPSWMSKSYINVQLYPLEEVDHQVTLHERSLGCIQILIQTSQTAEMYEHRGYNDHANTLLMHEKDKDGICMVAYLYQIKDSLLAYFVVKVQTRQSPDIPLVYFLVVQQNSDICAQFKPPLCVLTFWVHCSTISNFSTFLPGL